MSILNDTTPRLTRHLSDHHAVQGEAEYVERHAPEIGREAPAMGLDAAAENMIGWLLDRDCDQIRVVDDFPHRCGLDKPLNDPDTGDMLEVATLETEDSGYAPALWRLAIAVLKQRRAALTPAPQAEGQVRTLDPRVSLLEDLSAEDFLKDVDGCIDAGSDREDKTLDEIAALTASPGWQPIETAPRDGTRVLFWLADEGFPCLASWRKWDGYEGFYLWEMGDFADHNLPTHWMPLPAAPEAEGGCDDL